MELGKFEVGGANDTPNPGAGKVGGGPNDAPNPIAEELPTKLGAGEDPNDGAPPLATKGAANEGATKEGATKEGATNEGPLAPKAGATLIGKPGVEFDPKEALVFLNCAEPKANPPTGWFPKVNPACVVLVSGDPNTKFAGVDPNVLLGELSKEKPLEGCELLVPKLVEANAVD